MQAKIKGQQTETPTLALLEDKERPVAPQITLKYGDAFLVTDACGDLPASRKDMGLYWHGARFLHTCNLYLEGYPLVMLSHHIAHMSDSCQIDLTNTPLTTSDRREVGQGEIHIHRQIDLKHEQLIQIVTITSYNADPLSLTLSLKVDADFQDLFEARGLVREKRGQLLPPQISDAAVTWEYRGLDNVERLTQLTYTEPPHAIHPEATHWQLLLTRGEPVVIGITVQVSEKNAEQFARNLTLPSWQDLPQPTIHTDDVLFNRLLTRSMNDMMMLSTMTPYGYYPYAGIPWYACPFGRDGLIACLQFLPGFPEVVHGALIFLAAHQGTKVDAFTDEEPGKILHEMRTGEMANCREIAFIPYYGSIDVTPLFILTLEAYIRWTNDQALLHQLWPNVEAAVHWMMEYGDRDGDGFLEYQKTSPKGLDNQGWKDSDDAISSHDGQLAPSPIALCEVQGYAIAAYRAAAGMAEQLGKVQEQTKWIHQADTLQEKFLHHFWWEEEETFHLALDGNKQPCDVVSSNAGHCLWAGIVPQEKANKIIARLMHKDMDSGWGLRTLSTEAARYNPMSYHNGSVWPHDTAMVGDGFARYGGKAEASKLLQEMYHASLHFEGARLPELYCGFPRRAEYGPTRYPVACSPQAWAAGAPLMLINALVGLQPDAQAGCLTVEKPTLPAWLHHIEMKGLRLGGKQVHLSLVRSAEETQVVVGEENEVEIRVRK